MKVTVKQKMEKMYYDNESNFSTLHQKHFVLDYCIYFELKCQHQYHNHFQSRLYVDGLFRLQTSNNFFHSLPTHLVPIGL